ncbi:flagella biosynthesis regulator Flk [Enterobacteriaceae bacterium LUAb1]
MQPLNSTGRLPDSKVKSVTTRLPVGDGPLSPAQRTTLERLIIRIMALSNQKDAELWAGIYHIIGAKNETELMARHFPAAEDFLNTRLTQLQNSRAIRQLLQQLAALLPQGNNRQVVSDFIRQHFGHIVLSALSQEQLRQVLNMLQNGQITLPLSPHIPPSDRPLLPAEQHVLNQQIARLAAATDEHPTTIWHTALQLIHRKPGTPVPARYFLLLTQYLHTRQILSQHHSPTLLLLENTLKYPLNNSEKHLLEDYCQRHLQATPATVLTLSQAQDLLEWLFAHRADRQRERTLSDGKSPPQPLWHPFGQQLPAFLHPLNNHPLLTLCGLLFFAILVFLILF